MQIQSHNYHVEVLTFDDLCWFVEVAAVNMLYDEVNRPELVNIPHLYLLAEKGIQDKTAFICKYQGSNIGALGALLVPNTFNPERTTLAEIFWYVLPEYRETRAGHLLFKAFVELGDTVAHDSTLSLLPHSTVAMDGLQKRGFEFEEVGFRKRNKE